MGSREPVGSSANIKFPGFKIHLAIATLCCSPPDNVFTILVFKSNISNSFRTLSIRWIFSFFEISKNSIAISKLSTTFISLIRAND